MKLLRLLIACACLAFVSSQAKIIEIPPADAGVTVQVVGGAPAADGGADCSGTASLLWEMNDSDVSNGGCSNGDTSATASGTPSHNAGVATFTSGAYYTLTNSAEDIVDDAAGTVFIKFKIDTWEDGVRTPLHFEGDSNDEIYTYTQSGDGYLFKYEGNGNNVTGASFANTLSTGTWYIMRARWQDTGDPNTSITVFNADCSSTVQAEKSDNTNLTTMDTSVGSIYFGSTNGSTEDLDIDYIHLYKEFTDTDSNGDCSTVP